MLPINKLIEKLEASPDDFREVVDVLRQFDQYRDECTALREANNRYIGLLEEACDVLKAANPLKWAVHETNEIIQDAQQWERKAAQIIGTIKRVVFRHKY